MDEKLLVVLIGVASGTIGARQISHFSHFAAGRRRAKRDGRAAASSPCPASRGAWQNPLAAPERWNYRNSI
jgi:hypothetical protein